MSTIFLLSVFLTKTVLVAAIAPTMDDLWEELASFEFVRSFPQGDAALLEVNAGTKVVVVNDTWYLFGRQDSQPSGPCAQVISINVRASLDFGATWSTPTPVAVPDLISTCIYADGTAFLDQDAMTWHYLVQVVH